MGNINWGDIIVELHEMGFKDSQIDRIIEVIEENHE